jgi:hypothetical protein
MYRRIRSLGFIQRNIRPIYEDRLLRAWWKQGRPAPPPYNVKLASIIYLADRISAKVLVETGSFLGNTIRALNGRFDLIASIEIAPVFARPLQREFRNEPSIRIILGDSAIELSRLLFELNKPTVFWLDAHYSGGQTLGSNSVPIYAELDAIIKLAHPHHAILIDDVCDFKGGDGYPTAAEVVRRLKDASYEVAVFNNMIHALPATATITTHRDI